MGKAAEYSLTLFPGCQWMDEESIGDSGKRVLTMATQPMFNITVRRVGACGHNRTLNTASAPQYFLRLEWYIGRLSLEGERID